MSLQHKAYKFRIYPTPKQVVLLNKTFGSCRFLWNQLLAYNNNGYKELGKEWKLDFSEQHIKQNPEYTWLFDVSAASLQQARIDLKNGYTNFSSLLLVKEKEINLVLLNLSVKGKKIRFDYLIRNLNYLII